MEHTHRRCVATLPWPWSPRRWITKKSPGEPAPLQGCIEQSPGRLHGTLEVDDGKDVCTCAWGLGAGVATDAAAGNAPRESVACRCVCDGAIAPGAVYRGIGHPCTSRYSKALALGSRAQRFGLRMRWHATAGASWAL